MTGYKCNYCGDRGCDLCNSKETKVSNSALSALVINVAKHGLVLFIWLMLWCGIFVTMESYFLIENKMPYAVAGFALYPVLELIERIFKR